MCYSTTESETETPKKFPRLSLETEKKPRPSQALFFATRTILPSRQLFPAMKTGQFENILNILQIREQTRFFSTKLFWGKRERSGSFSSQFSGKKKKTKKRIGDKKVQK